MRDKVLIIGAGNVGSNTAQKITEKELADVILIDVDKDLAKARAIDITQANIISGSKAIVETIENYHELPENIKIVIITAGIPRKPGMTRDDLLSQNINIAKSISSSLKQWQHYSKPIYIIVTNPVEAITYAYWKLLGIEETKIMGLGGVLDDGRYKYYLWKLGGLNPWDIETMVIGQHGEDMVPLLSVSNLKGIPLKYLLEGKEKEIIERTVDGGGEIVRLLKMGSASYGPASAITKITETILKDTKRILPVVTKYENIFIGLPATITKNGICKIWTEILNYINEDEKERFTKAKQHVSSLLEKINNLLD